ncbi:MAG: aminotransferase class III-fold pyridoxal phosphate-dependent enzyme [Cycloclasticus sp.]
MLETYSLPITTLIVVLLLTRKIWVRLRLSRAKHPSLRGHSKWSRRIAKIIPAFDYDENEFFSSDNAPADVIEQRQQAFKKLTALLDKKFAKTTEFYHSLEGSISDIAFTSAYRVPFPYRKYLSQHLKLGAMVVESSGVKVKDLDDNWSYDLTGSYGVNVFGYDFYKTCIEQGAEQVKALGPVLGPYHPLIKDNVEQLKALSGLDEVSFHMSGTEAVMQAVRLARYHSGKTHLVRLCGAYHGWWDGVQPGIGNQRKTNDVYTLSDISERTLKVLETRNDIACVLINPLQGLHPNADASGDASLVNSSRSASFDRTAYTHWLKQLREVCTRRSIVLIFDEVFTGFRLAYRGAQEYFDIQADMVTYGKTLGGGLPIGVVCGKHELMQRFKPNRPVNVSFARGTFNSHPYVLASMNVFLKRIKEDDIQQQYQSLDDTWDTRVATLNRLFEENYLPVRIANLSSIWTVLYTQPSRYNWMYQYYLRAHGLALSWVGSGRIIMSHNFSDDDFEQVSKRFIDAAKEMKADAWWWRNDQLSDKSIKQQILRGMLSARFPALCKPLNKFN